MKRALCIRNTVVCCMCLLMSCSVGPQIKDGTIITTNADVHGNKITIRFTRGPDFCNIKQFGFIRVIITPQIAVWVEDTMGNWLQTLYVTRKFAKQDWGIVPHDATSCFRTNSMPYWLNKYMLAGNAAPTKNKPLPDAVTAATPVGSFDINSTMAPSPVCFVIKAEINCSFDTNEAFNSRRELSKINGQPAVVFAGRVNLNTLIDPIITMRLIGRSGETGTDSLLYKDMTGLTTAKRIIDCMNILFTSPPALSGTIADSTALTAATKRKE